jgi:hypothetical protein
LLALRSVPDFRLSSRSGLIDTPGRCIITGIAAVDFWLLARFLHLSAAAPMSTDASTPSQTLLEEIDAQQNELLDQLDSLNARVERVLRECVLRDLPLGVVAEGG